MADDKILNIEIPDSCGDNIQFNVNSDSLRVSIEEPLAGSTETGFGYQCHISLTPEHARQVLVFLNKHFGHQ